MTEFEARPEDGIEISRILDASTSNGGIDLLYTRRPDAYASYMKEPGEARVFAAKKDGVVISTCAELIREVYIGGEACRAAYICGLKKNPDYPGGAGISARIVREFQRDDIDFYFFGVLTDNPRAKEMFEKTSRLIQNRHVTNLKTYILSPRAKIKAPKHALCFRQATDEDLPALLDFLRDEGRKKDLFPVVKSLDAFYNLHIGDFYLLFDGDAIVACAALWNSTGYKQFIVRRYSPLMKFARLLNPLVGALGYVKLPKENAPIDFPMLSFFLTKDGREDYFYIFLNEVRKEVGKRYGMYVFDLPDGHFAREILDCAPHVGFRTMTYEIRFPWSGQAYKTVDPARLATESGLL